MANIEQFNKMASRYETETRVKLFELFKNELQELSIHGNVLDFGCGTGNLGISIANSCESVCLLDPSASMRELLEQKITAQQLDNCYVSATDLEQDEKLEQKFDFIIIAQVLLHIPNYKQILRSLITNLNEGGSIVIFDYKKNNEVYSDIVHNGFELQELIEYITTCGLVYEQDKIIYKSDNILLGGSGELFMLVMSNLQ